MDSGWWIVDSRGRVGSFVDTCAVGTTDAQAIDLLLAIVAEEPGGENLKRTTEQRHSPKSPILQAKGD
jgi:hypothetical protein